MSAISDFDTSGWDSTTNNVSMNQDFFEKLYVLDYIPVVSNISGIARIAFGLLETIFGVLTSPLELVRNIFSGNKHKYIAMEGMRNVVRGVIAKFPILGNALLYYYDKSNELSKG